MKHLKVILIVLTSVVFTVKAQIVKSNISLEKAIEGTSAPKNVSDRFVIVNVEYFSTDNNLHQGQIVIDSTLKNDIIEIFNFIKSEKIIIDMVIPIKFDLPNNGTTMAKLNNTYSFHYRDAVNGSFKSQHSYARAIDINPFNNPYIKKDGSPIPVGAIYNPENPKSLTAKSKLVEKFKSLGWTWGGDWESPKDYMHFEKK